MTRYRKILLRNTGKHALVDAIDYDMVMRYGSWYENDNGYAIKRVSVDGKKKTIRMHALINGTPKGLMTDHINGNRLDNRRKNLRSVNATVNAWNRKETNQHRVYVDLPTGVSFDKNRNKYLARKIVIRRFDKLKDAVNFTKQSKKGGI